MDKKQQHRHSSFSSSYPAPSRSSLPYPPPRRSTSLKHAINCEFSFFVCLYFIFFFVLYLLTSWCTDTSEPPRPASLVRVKGQMAMNTPPPKSSGTLASVLIHPTIFVSYQINVHLQTQHGPATNPLGEGRQRDQGHHEPQEHLEEPVGLPLRARDIKRLLIKYPYCRYSRCRCQLTCESFLRASTGPVERTACYSGYTRTRL